MGLIDFFKNAGEKIFGGESEEEKKEKLVKHVTSLGLPVEGLSISVDDETVTVKGKVDSVGHSEKIALAVGNVEGVSKVDNQLTVETPEQVEPEPQATYHTVEKGDSLSKISKEVYGDPMKYNAIFEANKPMLKHPDKIYPGQVLRIPPKESLA
ncbi:peptidoglycan-binding protein LysM [Tunicatimonas pelagia]|uniref:peptidoglycan-binding protein LysM n=1 Tax=Tunicatimonas pelagia TaxID=931531 RepID=UPI0026654FE7|nr:peptidoglycan-binding protein LysM [Tunicatimonas pelagia]WKN44623.1 peptidoglycan-binding protein LysM [Tunicatimonas pelagia]